jgi:hypothetical protein
MSDGRLVRVLKQKHGAPYVAFEKRQYHSQELTKFVGQTITVRKYIAGDTLTAVSPDGTVQFCLFARHSSSSSA